MKHYGLIGEHLGHSLSVPIHEIVFRELGIHADYKLIEIPKEGFSETFSGILPHYDGLNVTIPYKKDVMPHMHKLDPLATQVGAVNTIAVSDTVTGYNTDVKGFAVMLETAGIPVEGKPCYILGTGGASLAIHVALRQLGAASVTFVSRTPRNGMLSYDELTDVFSGVLVNCTPAGMFPHSDTCPLTEKQLDIMLPRASGVADLIYNPSETLLTRAAHEAGIPRCTGLTMLVAQALEAERIWQGHDMPSHLLPLILSELPSFL